MMIIIIITIISVKSFLRQTNTWYVVCLLKNAQGRTYNDQRRSPVNTEQLQQTLFTHINLALNNSPDQQRLIVVHQSMAT